MIETPNLYMLLKAEADMLGRALEDHNASQPPKSDLIAFRDWCNVRSGLLQRSAAVHAQIVEIIRVERM